MTLATTFAQEHGRLFGIAYRILGEVGAAQDAVQEAFVRLERQPPGHVLEPAAWLTTVVSRLCLDHLASARARREVYVGPWLPEPLVEGPSTDPADAMVLRESVTQAFLVVLESLTPTERVAFVLREVFEHDYATIAEVLGLQEPAVRQLVSRSRKAVDARRPRYDPPGDASRAVADAFLVSVLGGDVDGLLRLLAPDVVLSSDGGGKAIAVRVPVTGAREVARVLGALLRRPVIGATLERWTVNGMPGFILRRADGTPETVFSMHVAGGLLTAVNAMRNPDKLGSLPGPGPNAVALADLAH